jgi:DNA (cytosine-5)-methyltransferase 1
MEHLGDISKIHGGDIEPCDLVTFGSPCVGLSCAGLGLGFGDSRSALFFEAVRVIREMLEASAGASPRYFLFENVPNLISIHKGADWKIVMDAFADLGFICDPNILDAAEFGVAQRRKRIFIVGVNRRYYNPAAFAGIPNARAKAMQRAVDAWGGETFHGVTSRPHTTVRQKLSEILERNVDPKYLLSAKACIGILRRAGVRGKKLPELLRIALEIQAGLGCDISEAAASVLRSAGFCTEHSAKARSVGYEDEKSPTLRAGTVPAAVVYDARGNGDGEICCTITGDHNGHISDYTALAVEPTTMKIRAGNGPGGRGILCQHNLSATLSTGNDQTLFVPMAYGISSFMSNAMMSPNPSAGIYEAETARTLDTGGGNPGCQQGGLCIVDDSCVAYGIDRAAFNQGKNALYLPQFTEESVTTLTAQGPSAVSAPPSYTVRRLTPTECLALMNLPTDWCDGLETPEPTEEDIAFWTEVWETQRRIMGTSSRPKSRNQIVKWLSNHFSDSACYKLAGNGICVSIAVMLFKGIKEYENRRLAENNTT